MIIQNLHRFFRTENQEYRIKTSLFLSNKLVFSFLFSFFSFLAIAQDSIVPQANIEEKKNLQFQEYFFKAITEKGIKNYQKAIDNLESANEVIPNNKAVLFELSKNYLSLNKTFEATQYANEALAQDPENLWILEHLVTVYKKDRNFVDAINTQQKIIKNHPKKKQDLVYLQLQNGDINAAKETLEELAVEKLLTSRLRKIQSNLTSRKRTSKPKNLTVTKVEKSDLRKQFETDKSFATLKKLLQKLNAERSSDLVKYSQQGMELYPAQPYVYLMNGRAHNQQKSFKKALDSLQNGIDFVIDNPTMEADFYNAMASAYAGLGNTKEATKYKNKAAKIK